MNNWNRIVALASWAASAALGLAEAPKVELAPVYQNIKFSKPLRTVIPPDGSARLFLIQQTGQIRVLPPDRSATEAPVFLDLSGRDIIDNGFEEGLLGLAFHPEFKANRTFYVYYSHQNPKRSVISEMTVDPSDPNRADLASERVLLEVPQPFWNHNSGYLEFGPDGYLYVSFGDGGRANDPFNNAQDLTTLLGTIIRVDVNSRTGSLPYGIPHDNPFLGYGHRARPEIWAYGLRNPWGIHFDPETGDLWCADVGQNKYEEINLIVKGGNYGWNYREGFHAFDLNPSQAPESAAFIDPVHEYGRSEGISVTGGLVYRGGIAGLAGRYLYSDWFSGAIWALTVENGAKVSNETIFTKDVASPIRIGGFSEDLNREVLVFSLDGTIWEMRSAATEGAN